MANLYSLFCIIKTANYGVGVHRSTYSSQSACHFLINPGITITPTTTSWKLQAPLTVQIFLVAPPPKQIANSRELISLKTPLIYSLRVPILHLYGEDCDLILLRTPYIHQIFFASGTKSDRGSSLRRQKIGTHHSPQPHKTSGRNATEESSSKHQPLNISQEDSSQLIENHGLATVMDSILVMS